MTITEENISSPIIYIVAIENIVRSPIVRSQTINLIKEMKAKQLEHSIILVSLYPIINYFKYRHQISQLRSELQAHGIKLYVLPILYLTRHFYISRFLFPFYFFQVLLAVLWIGICLRPMIVHCRSYPATVVGHWIKKFTKAKLIFDTRNLYPEEGATLIKSWKAVVLNGASFRMWKKIEARLIQNADITTVVSQPTVSVFASQYPEATERFVVIPQPTPVASLQDLKNWRQQTRQELGLSNGERLVVYMGSWFEPEPTLILFKRLLMTVPNYKWYFLLLVSNKQDVDDELSQFVQMKLGMSGGCTALSVPHAQVARYLAGADLAAHPMYVPEHARDDDRYYLRAKTWQSIKFTEYLACGLPLLVSQWVGAVAECVQKNDLGLVYDQASDAELAAWLRRWQAQRDDFRQRAWAYARENFAIDVVAQRYLDLYRQLLNEEM